MWSNSGEAPAEASASSGPVFQHIDSVDVIRLILQFLQENGLHNSVRALQDESQIANNTVER